MLGFSFNLQELAVPLRGYVENFPKKNHLHPYEQSLIEFTLGDGNYEEVSLEELIAHVLLALDPWQLNLPPKLPMLF